MTNHQKIKNLISEFESAVLFNPEYDHLKIQSAHLEHSEGERRAVVITSNDKDLEAVREIIQPYFKDVPFEVLHEDGHAQCSFTLKSGKGIRNVRSDKRGTVGGFFPFNGKMYGMSNSHVLSDFGRGKKGDTIVYDPNKRAGKLIKFNRFKKPPQVNRNDVGIFSLNSTNTGKWDPKPPKSKKPIGAQVNMRVIKKGAASIDTKGIIRGVNAAVKVTFEGQEYFFKNVIIISGVGGKDFNKPGDSGSVVLSFPNRYMVALVFAKKNQWCYAIPMSRALKIFNGL